MSRVVMKFGGSSVADAACIRRVAGRVQETAATGAQVVVVVSAMGKTTDGLIRLAREVNADPNAREYDMLLATGEQISVALLAMALHALDVPAVSMTGAQAGIFTDDAHSRARIRDIQPVRVEEELAAGRVVIVAGFQGLNRRQDIVTLGRGGSDLSAVALAAALKADLCQIFTDVEGVYTADPRVEPSARKLDVIHYDEMLELASMGAKVLQSRSVEFAKKYSVKLEVLSSFTHTPGTRVTEENHMEDVIIRGIAADTNQAKITLRGVQDRPGMAALLFRELATAQINVDMIIQNAGERARTDISFTIPSDDVARARVILDRVAPMLGATSIGVSAQIAKVSLVGVGMRSHTAVAGKVFDVMAENGINIHMISTSEIRISMVIDVARADQAVRLLHAAFGLAGGAA